MHKVSDSVRSAHGQDGAIVLDVQQGQMFNLNLVGSRILQMLEKGKAEPVITAQISQEFGIREEIVRADLKEFVQTLARYGLLETSTPKAVCPQDAVGPGL
jgi:hypothetical protein